MGPRGKNPKPRFSICSRFKTETCSQMDVMGASQTKILAAILPRCGGGCRRPPWAWGEVSQDQTWILKRGLGSLCPKKISLYFWARARPGPKMAPNVPKWSQIVPGGPQRPQQYKKIDMGLVGPWVPGPPGPSVGPGWALGPIWGLLGYLPEFPSTA